MKLLKGALTKGCPEERASKTAPLRGNEGREKLPGTGEKYRAVNDGSEKRGGTSLEKGDYQQV